MFSCNIHLLPSFYTYEAVVDWYNKVPQPRRKHWQPDERPLDGPAKHHYRIKRTGAQYQIILYRTPIVTWNGPNMVTVDVSYGGSTTMQFAYRYCGFLGSPFKEGGQNVFRVDGVKYQTKEPFIFVHVGHPDAPNKDWKLTSLHKKITRQVLDPDKAHVYRQVATPFKKWVRGVWALANDEPDGANHPWVGLEFTPHLLTKEYVFAALARQEDWPQLVQEFCGRQSTYLGIGAYKYENCPTQLKTVLGGLDRHMQAGMYTAIPYDAPLPKRSKK
jgi:hypothetical protein